MKYKNVLKYAFYEMINAKDQYILFNADDYNKLNPTLMMRFLKTFFIMNTPIIPHFTEYMYVTYLNPIFEKSGLNEKKVEFLYKAKFPEPTSEVDTKLFEYNKYMNKVIQGIRDASSKKIKKGKKEKKEEKSKLIKKLTFVEFLVNEITEGIKKEEKMSYLENLANEFEDEKFELMKNIYEEIKNKSNIIIEYGIDFDDEYDDSMVYMRAFYQNFAKKLKFPEHSEDIKVILDYFNNFKDKSGDLETAPLVTEITEEGPETKAIKILKNIFQKLQKYVNKNDKDHIINELSSNLDIMEKFVLNNRKIYIPFIGVSSAGKTTTINGIVGYKLFPEALNECTTRGIIIEYSDVIELYEMQIDSNNNYYVFNEKNKVADGFKEVREYI